MAGWTTTTWDDGGAYYQAVADELWAALNERLEAIPVAPEFLPEQGANLQMTSTGAPGSTTGTFSLRYIQGKINSIVANFVQSHGTDGAPRLPDYYSGETTIPYWTFENLMTAVNGGTHFRRKTVWGGAFSSGYAQAGDILGAWILEDIQKALNMLIWTGVFTTTQSSYTTYYGSGTSTSWATAKASADAGYIETPVGMTMPQAASLGSKSGADFTAWKERARVKHNATVPNPKFRTVCFFMSIAKIGCENPAFNAQGDNVVENALSLLSSVYGNDATVTSDWFGGTSVDQWCDEPTTLINGLGWQRSSSSTGKALARWDVTDGFTYY